SVILMVLSSLLDAPLVRRPSRRCGRLGRRSASTRGKATAPIFAADCFTRESWFRLAGKALQGIARTKEKYPPGPYRRSLPGEERGGLQRGGRMNSDERRVAVLPAVLEI